jgi:hypothetical protein
MGISISVRMAKELELRHMPLTEIKPRTCIITQCVALYSAKCAETTGKETIKIGDLAVFDARSIRKLNYGDMGGIRHESVMAGRTYNKYYVRE